MFDLGFNKAYQEKKRWIDRYHGKGSLIDHDVRSGIFSLSTALHQMSIDRKTLERAFREKVDDNYMAKLLGEGFGDFFAAIGYFKLLKFIMNNFDFKTYKYQSIILFL